MKRRLPLLFSALISLSAFASTGHEAATGPSGWESYAEMQNGNMRFYEGKQRHPHQDPATRDALATGQKPHTIVLSCSDSRVPPEEIFDQGLGDIFSVRLAGNVVTPEALASIEYAVSHLGPKFVLVMGHESCGAIGAAVASKAGVSNGSESLDVLVNQIRGNLSSAGVAAAGADKTMRQAVKENVSATVKDLLKKSEIVRSAVAKGLLIGHGIYSLKSGRVEFWDMGAKSEAAAMAAVADGPAIQEQNVQELPVKAEKAPTKTKAKVHH